VQTDDIINAKPFLLGVKHLFFPKEKGLGGKTFFFFKEKGIEG